MNKEQLATSMSAPSPYLLNREKGSYRIENTKSKSKTPRKHQIQIQTLSLKIGFILEIVFRIFLGLVFRS
jgi:hypothetical protein